MFKKLCLLVILVASSLECTTKKSNSPQKHTMLAGAFVMASIATNVVSRALPDLERYDSAKKYLTIGSGLCLVAGALCYLNKPVR